MKIKIEVLHKDLPLPKFSTKGSAGVDFYAPKDIIIPPHGSVIVPLGVKLELPEGICMIMKEKSGIAVKHRLSIGACVIDSDYRGEVHAHFFSHNTQQVVLPKHTKIIQGIMTMYCTPQFVLGTVSNNTERGEGKFGSTGV